MGMGWLEQSSYNHWENPDINKSWKTDTEAEVEGGDSLGTPSKDGKSEDIRGGV